jgi:hypothetical protein
MQSEPVIFGEPNEKVLPPPHGPPELPTRGKPLEAVRGDAVETALVENFGLEHVCTSGFALEVAAKNLDIG